MATLEDVLRDFERRISVLEGNLKPGPAPSERMAVQPAAPAAPPPSSRPIAPKKDRTPFFLGLLGIFFLILAGAFFIKLTLDSGWLTPLRQVILSAVLGLSFLSLPHFNRHFSDSYGALLSGTGVVILHLTWFGAYQVHGLIGMHAALVVATAVGVLSLLMNGEHGNFVFAVVAIAGTYLSAPLIGHTQGIGSMLVFVLVWNIAFSALAVETKRRETLLIAAYFAFLNCGLLMLEGNLPEHPFLAQQLLILMVVQFLIFTVGTMLFTLRHKTPLSALEAWALFPVLLIFYLLTNGLLEIVAPWIYPYNGLAVGVVVLLASLMVAKRQEGGLPSTPSLGTFALIVIMHSLYFNLASPTLQPYLSFVLAIGLSQVLRLMPGQSKQWGAAIFLLGALVIYGVFLSFDTALDAWDGLLFCFAWGLLALVGLVVQAPTQLSHRQLLLSFGHLEFLSGLYRLSEKFDLNQVWLTVLWGLYALLILGLSTQRKDRTMGQSAVLILTAVSLKVAFFDLWSSDDLKRIGSLVIAGALLYSCGWIYRKVKAWS